MSTDKEKHVTPSEFNRAIKERIEYLEKEETKWKNDFN